MKKYNYICHFARHIWDVLFHLMLLSTEYKNIIKTYKCTFIGIRNENRYKDKGR